MVGSYSTDENTSAAGRRVVVVGAGLVGAVQALLFARAGFKVTVVEQKQLRSEVAPAEAISSRTVALSHRSWQLLSAAGLWPEIQSCPIRTVHVTEQGKFGSIKLHADKLDVEALGYVVPNAGFESYLVELLRKDPDIEIIESASITAVTDTPQSATVIIEEAGLQRELLAHLVVAADGTDSSVRELLNISTQQRDYKQCAVLANVSTEQDHKHMAFERFTAEGPLALLPLAATNKGGRSQMYSMIYTAPAIDADRLTDISDAEFLALVQKKFGGKLGRFKKIGKRFVTPLKLTTSAKQVEGRFVLIGNAVRTLHPVAGQGMNLALRDVFELVACVADQENIHSSLNTFVKRRSRDQWLITRQTDLLARVFTDKPWPIRAPLSLMTSSSFLLLDFLEPLKKAFAKTNMGRHVPLPGTSRDSVDTQP